MDPDQVADAGVQHDDDLGGSATYAAGCCDGGSGDSWARALLRRGWDLSRKAAIAGVAATAAPVVAPSLLVLSLAGVALSLPFAAYLASLAATDRLMGALLPAPRTQPYHAACDLGDDGFFDASEAPGGGEAPVFDHWRDAENDAITEENESSVSLPLSRGPRFSEEPVPSSTPDVEDKMPGGQFLFRELGQESLELDNKEHEQEGTTMEDTAFITMEMEAPPRGSNVFGSAVPVLRDEDNVVQRVVEAPLTAKESVQELSVSDNEDRTEIPLQEVNVSESSVLDDTMLERKIELEGDITVEMVVKEVSISTDPFTGEVAGEQVDSIATALPQSESSNLVPQELQAMAEVAYVAQELQAVGEAAVVGEIRGSTVIEDIKNELSDRTTKGVEHHSDRGTCSFVSGVPEATADDSKDVVPSRSTHASARDSVPVFDNPHQTTGVEYKPVNEGFRRNDVAEDMDNYTEEQLREQLDTLRTITGYHPAPPLTLEAEIVGLYIFVGVEPPVSSGDASDLNDLNTKLRFLKSIIGVE